MSYICNGTRQHLPTPHSHEAVEDAKRCYGILGAVPAPVAHAAAPFRFGSRTAPRGPLSASQHRYIGDLGGDLAYAKTLSYEDASAYITRLRNDKFGGTVTSHTPAPAPEPPVKDARLSMVEALLGSVPDGYYATQEYEGGHVDFIRLSTPKSGRYSGTRKVQFGRGSWSRLIWDEAAVCWTPNNPSPRWSFMGGRDKVLQALMFLCADHQGAAMRFADKIGKCARCNAALTDGNSRHFGIGPECEKHWPWFIDRVLEIKGPFTGER